MTLQQHADHGPASYLQKVIDSTPAIICRLNNDGLFKFISAEAQMLLGYSSQDLAGKSFTDFVSHKDVEKTRNSLHLLKSGIDTLSLHNECMKKDGSLIVLFWICRWDMEEKEFYCIGHSATEKA